MTPAPNKPSGRRPLILHPLLLAVYVVLAPLAENIDIVGPLAVRSLLLAILAVSLFLALSRLVLRDSLKAGLLASGASILFASYGHAQRVLESVVQLGWGKWLLAILWISMMCGWAYWLLKTRRTLVAWTSYANAVAVLLLAYPLVRILQYTRSTPELRAHIQEYRDLLLARDGLADLGEATPASRLLPDVYYVILDAYTRADVMSRVYGFDNSAFVEALTQRGFYVPTRSCSNYPETVPSLASSLNMSQIQDAPEALRPWVDTDREEILRDGYALLIEDNVVAEFLRARGYEWVVFDSGSSRTAVSSADVFDRAPGVPSFDARSAFELMVLDTTFWQAYLDLRGPDYMPFKESFDHHRERVLHALTHLSDYADRPGAQFVFAHVISPHAPYVFGPNGEPVTETDPFSLLDEPTVTEWDPAPYLDQVTYVNRLILDEIDEILDKSETDPIILLQADHGSRVATVPQVSLEMMQMLLYPSFAAYRLPAGRSDWYPYPTMTPVNLFRVVLNRYFGTELPLLPDENFRFARSDGRLKIEQACLSLGGCGTTDADEPTVGLPPCR